MNPEHVSVEDRRPQTSFPDIRPSQGSLVSPSWIPSQPVSEESHELRRKQKIIDRALEKITARGLCGVIAGVAPNDYTLMDGISTELIR